MKTNHALTITLLQRLNTWRQLACAFPLQRYLAHLFITAPMVLLVIYLVIFSQPRYMSESKVAVKRPNEIDSSSLNVGLLLGASNPSSAEDSLYLKEYINSPDMLMALDKRLNFHKAFSGCGNSRETLRWWRHPEDGRKGPIRFR